MLKVLSYSVPLYSVDYFLAIQTASLLVASSRAGKVDLAPSF